MTAECVLQYHHSDGADPITSPEKRSLDRLKSLWPVSRALGLLADIGLPISDSFLVSIGQTPPLCLRDEMDLEARERSPDYTNGRKDTPDYLYLKIRALLGDKTEKPLDRKSKERRNAVLTTAAYIAQAAGVRYLDELSARTLGMGIHDVIKHVGEENLFKSSPFNQIAEYLINYDRHIIDGLFPSAEGNVSSRLFKKDLISMVSSVVSIRKCVDLLKVQEELETVNSSAVQASSPEITLNNLSDVYRYLRSICLTKEEHLIPRELRTQLLSALSAIEKSVQEETSQEQVQEPLLSFFHRLLNTHNFCTLSPKTRAITAISLLALLTAVTLTTTTNASAEGNKDLPTPVWQPSSARLVEPDGRIRLVNGEVVQDPSLAPLSQPHQLTGLKRPDSDVFPPYEGGTTSLYGVNWPGMENGHLVLAPGNHGSRLWPTTITVVSGPGLDIESPTPYILRGPTDVPISSGGSNDIELVTVLTSGPPTAGFMKSTILGKTPSTFLLNPESLTHLQVILYTPGSTVAVLNPDMIGSAHVTAHFFDLERDGTLVETVSMTAILPPHSGIPINPGVVNDAPPDYGLMVVEADDGNRANPRPRRVATQSLMRGDMGNIAVINNAVASQGPSGDEINVDFAFPVGYQNLRDDRTFTIGSTEWEEPTTSWISSGLYNWARSSDYFPDGNLTDSSISTIFAGDKLIQGANAIVYNTCLRSDDSYICFRHVGFNPVNDIPGVNTLLSGVIGGTVIARDTILIVPGGIGETQNVPRHLTIAGIVAHEAMHITPFCLDHTGNSGNFTNELCSESARHAVVMARGNPPASYQQYLRFCREVGIPVYGIPYNPFCVGESAYSGLQSFGRNWQDGTFDPLYLSLTPQIALSFIRW